MKNLNTTQRLCIALIALIALMSGCYSGNLNDNGYKRSTLDKKYDFIVGVLTPDGLRDYQQEIFVGTRCW